MPKAFKYPKFIGLERVYIVTLKGTIIEVCASGATADKAVDDLLRKGHAVSDVKMKEHKVKYQTVQ